MIEVDTNDILLVDKPVGWTSFDVVAKIRGQIRRSYLDKGVKPTKRQLRVGHAGTLDPFATGLLIVLVGDACKQAGEFLKLDKTYEFTAMLGKVSTTGDPEGTISDVAVEGSMPSLQDVEQVLSEFVGDISQVPPAYSAIKVDGKRAYTLAREGRIVALVPRVIKIHRLDLLEYEYPLLRCRASVGSGTYIRTLVEDIAKALGTGAYCTQLRRTVVGNYSIENAVVVEAIVSS
ncbi:tRNA pseudouridine(55) synthase TruB [Candidatus Saccharibacteria bacterium]|nr:tRNA pseudouridine(55) synthase TruB [Candidatus Saccharibacteria bacterium]